MPRLRFLRPLTRLGLEKMRNLSPNMVLYWTFLLPSSVCLAFTCFNQCFPKKENQPSLLEDVRLFFEDQSNKNEWEICQTVEKNAGRNEKRICRKIKDISWMKEHKSSRDTCAKQLMELARKHWKIESMHWILDVTFSEDDCRFLSENTHKSMNALRKFALAVHKIFLAAHHKKSSIKASMLSTLLDSNLLHFL